MDIESALNTLPSMQSFVDGIAGGAARGRVTLTLLPNTVSREMVGRLILNRLHALNSTVGELSSLGDGRPAVAVAEALGASWRSPRVPRDAANLLRCGGMPSAVYLHRVPERRREWTEFMEDWARESAEMARAGERCPSLCAVAKLRDIDFALPSTDAGVEIRWWWGTSSALETRLACRVANREHDDDDSLKIWREYILPSLASGDPELAAWLWNAVSGPLEAIADRLIEYADNAGWTDFDESALDAVQRTGADAHGGGTNPEPPENLREIWADGGLTATAEHGIEIHPALLARCGRRGEIAYMLWRGQAELLLPALNEIRMKICRELRDAFGENWHARWWSRPLPDGNPLGAELSYLRGLFDLVGTGPSHPLNQKRRFYDLIALSHALRNKIAHNEPVAFADFAALWRERGKAGI